MRLWKRGIIAGLPFAALLWTTSVAHGVAVGRGSSLPSGDVTLNDPSLASSTLPTLTDSTFSSGDNLTGNIVSGGFSTSGTLSFTTNANFTSGNETLTYTIDQSIGTLTPGNYQLFSSANGGFAAASGTLISYEVQTSLIDTSSTNAQFDSAVALLPNVSLTLSNSISTFIFAGYSSIITISSSAANDSFELQQSVTVSFISLTTGDNVYVNFPNGSGFVPEPSSLSLLGIGACGLMGYSWRRRRGQRALVAVA